MDFVCTELACAQCGTMFAFSAYDQRSFHEKGFRYDPKLCKQCKARQRTDGGELRPESHWPFGG
jgi:hypothetical protein